jgi:hypothetical protein
MMMMTRRKQMTIHYPKIDDLNPVERDNFILWLDGKSLPHIDGTLRYFPDDLLKFKTGLPLNEDDKTSN